MKDAVVEAHGKKQAPRGTLSMPVTNEYQNCIMKRKIALAFSPKDR
jgi:hypothetical protein